MTALHPDRTPGLTAREAPAAPGLDLGRELRRIRTEELGLTGPKMAEWLGVATRDDHGRLTSTGKALVSRFESGARRPDETVLGQYAKAPGVDADRLHALWSAAVDVPRAAPEVPAGPSGPSAGGPLPDDAGSAARRPGRRVLVGLTAVAVLVVVVAAVVVWRTGRGTDARPDTPGFATTPVPGVSVVFDALGAQSDQTIRIFHGPGGSASDRAIDGTYENGQTAAVVCLTSGRTVTSDPAENEKAKTSDRWARIVSSSGRISYATMTYARISPTTAAVPDC